ncbi:MAG: LysM peptidoglycan-binding domain-containing protein [Chloroflexota bacterium]|nr:LysM peptidoglycan-binding domain-containing protein [Chloroflexota bacterium]
MADHGGGGHGDGSGRRASDSKGGGGVLAAVTGNGCLRYLALYIVALVLLAGLAIANGAGLLQKLGLPAFNAPSVAHTNSSNLAAAPAGGTSSTGTGSNVSTASGGGSAKAPTGMIRSAPVAGAQGSQITTMTASPFYIVHAGETLDTVAAMFGLTHQQLRDYNNLKDEMLYIGQVLYLPASNNPPVPNTGRNAGGNNAAPSNAGSTDDSTP